MSDSNQQVSIFSASAEVPLGLSAVAEFGHTLLRNVAEIIDPRNLVADRLHGIVGLVNIVHEYADNYYPNSELMGLNLARRNYAGYNLFRSDLRGCDLNEANLAGIGLMSCCLTNATLIRANLREASLVRIDLTGPT